MSEPTLEHPNLPEKNQEPVTEQLKINLEQSRVKSIRNKIQHGLEIGIRHLFFWESDDKRIGSLLKVLHQYFITAIVICYVLVHTFIPSYWFMVSIWIVVVATWIQHMILGGCVLTRLEQKLTGEKVTIVDPILDLFQIPISTKSQMGITLLFSTISSIFLSFELFTRTLLNLQSWFPQLKVFSI
jgi:hypothetical protein